MYYSSIFQQLFKFISRDYFDKMAEETSGNVPCFVALSCGKMSDICAENENIVIIQDSIYTFNICDLRLHFHPLFS